MEDNQPKSIGYQKKIEKKDTPPPKPKKSSADYYSPLAKKWPAFLEALQNGNVTVVQELIKEGMNVNLARNGVTPLMIVASKGNVEMAKVIIQAGININERGDEGETALHRAASDQAGIAIVDLLQESGVDVEAKNKSGKTALQLAEERGHRDIALHIKKHQQQLQVDAREWEEFLNTPEGKPFEQKRLQESLRSNTKFLWAPPLALGGAGLLIGLIFNAVFLPGIIGIVSGVLVDVAFFIKQMSVDKFLSQFDRLPDLDIYILRAKRKAGEPIGAKKISRKAAPKEPVGTTGKGASPASHLEQGLVVLSEEPVDDKSPKAKMGNPKIIGYAVFAFIIVILIGLLFIKRDFIAQKYYGKKLEMRNIPFSEQAFLDMVSKNNEEAVDLFMKAGMTGNVKNEQGQTALMIASEKGHANILNKLIKQDASLLHQWDAHGNTPLMTAARRGNEAVVKVLVESGADVNFKVPDHEGAVTALQAALDASDFKDEHMKIIHYLLEKGADVKAKNKSWRFPLLFAADHGRTEAAKLLIEKGADVNDKDQNGNFPLLAAACKGDPELVALFADRGASMSMASPEGQTPLMCAAREGNLAAIKVLLAKGVPINARTANGSTALIEAASAGKRDAVKLLLEQGADPGGGSVPGSFIAFNGRTITAKGKKNRMDDVLKNIAKAASQDGYTINLGSAIKQTTTASAKGPWNKVLNDIAKKNFLFLAVKDKQVFVYSYDPAAIKHAGN